MILKVAYDDSSEKFFKDLTILVENNYPLLKIEGFHENKLKERSKAFKLKGGFSARKNPFAVLFDDDNIPVKAFYTEANECVLLDIAKGLDSFIIYKTKNI